MSRLAAPVRVVLPALALLVVGGPASIIQQPQPDVFLASLAIDSGRVRIGAPRNVTARPGYDNQPSFAADGRTLYFTSTREDAQADIYRYDVARGRTERVTTTAPESEYSATEVPGGGAISVIRVERDSTQRLWRLPLRRGQESPIFPALKPVGYHAWADASHIAMFVLGSPPALALGDVRTGKVDTLMMNVGRSLHRIPGSTRISFVSKAYEEAWYIMDLDVETKAIHPLVRLPKGTEDYAWLPDGRLIAASGSAVLLCDLTRQSQWEQIADLATAGLSGITRIAVSPAGDQIALVAIPATAR